MWWVCGQLRGVTLERNKNDYFTYDGGKIVAKEAFTDIEMPYPTAEVIEAAIAAKK